MCGRYVVARTLTGALPDLLSGLEGWNPDLENFNIPPTSSVPIVVEEVTPGSGEVSRRVDIAHWGFVPAWKAAFEQRPQPINARLETVATNGMFRRAFQRGHCIVPASGYYEWRVNPDGTKQPFYIHGPAGGGLAMAGIYEDWSAPDTDASGLPPQRTMAILTRDAVGPAQAIHDRMPVLLDPDDYEAWLGADVTDPARLRHHLEQVSGRVAQTLVTDPVGKAVGNVRNNGPELIAPIAPADRGAL